MSFLALVVKPLAYISLPVLLFRSIANTSSVGRYYWRASVFLGSLAAVSIWGIVVAVGMTLVGRRHDVNYVVARTFYNWASRVLELEVEVEGEEYLQTRPAVIVGNHQSMLDILYLARSVPFVIFRCHIFAIASGLIHVCWLTFTQNVPSKGIHHGEAGAPVDTSWSLDVHVWRDIH